MRLLLSTLLLSMLFITFSATPCMSQEIEPTYESLDTRFTRRNMGVRITSETSFAAIFGAVTLAIPLTALVVTTFDPKLDHFNTKRGYDPLAYALVATFLAYPVAVGGGTLLGGWLTGGRATDYAPFVGAFGGSMLSAFLGFTFMQFDLPELAAWSMILLPIIGSVLAYELWDASETKRIKGQKERVYMPLQFSFSF